MPPLSVASQPWTSPTTNKQQFVEVLRVISLFRQIRAGQHSEEPGRKEFRVGPEEYSFLERTLQEDEALEAFVASKIRYDYYEEEHRLVVRMPSSLHDTITFFVAQQICLQLLEIGNWHGRKAQFARRIEGFSTSDVKIPNSRSHKSPDAQFRHMKARFPGVIIETGYSREKKQLERKAESYLLDSNASVRAVVCIDVNYKRGQSQRAGLSIWQAEVINTADGLILQAVKVDDQEFRNSEGHAVNNSGLRLPLSKFANEELIEQELGDDEANIYISGAQLCEKLNGIERYAADPNLSEHALAVGITKRLRSLTPPTKSPRATKRGSLPRRRGRSDR